MAKIHVTPRLQLRGWGYVPPQDPCRWAWLCDEFVFAVLGEQPKFIRGAVSLEPFPGSREVYVYGHPECINWMWQAHSKALQNYLYLSLARWLMECYPNLDFTTNPRLYFKIKPA